MVEISLIQGKIAKIHIKELKVKMFNIVIIQKFKIK